MTTKKEKKALYFIKVAELFKKYDKIMLVNVDNVSSSLMQKSRHALLGKAVILMGKNTLIRRAIMNAKNIPGAQALMNALRENVGLVFTNLDLAEIKDIITKNKISGPAKPGQVAPCDVTIPKGNTGLEPGQTTFLQALNIATKITKGTIEILNDVKIITKGEKVGNSEATLLTKLRITPFFFEIRPLQVFEHGMVFPIDILDVKEEELATAFAEGNKNVTAVCMAASIPCAAAIPYYLKDGFKNCLAICEATSFTFPLHARYSQAAASAVVVAAAPAAAAGAGAGAGAGKAEEKKEEPKEEKKEEEEEVDADLGDLFG